jgi:hypothetical protein
MAAKRQIQGLSLGNSKEKPVESIIYKVAHRLHFSKNEGKPST